MREQIKKYIATRNDVSFPELMQAVPDSAGEVTIYFDNDSLVLWEGTSQLFADSFESLLADGSIVLERIDGDESARLLHAYAREATPNDLPVAKRIQNYTKPHWLPTVICDGTLPQHRQ